MRRFNKVTIIGVGLIGGSIGLAIKKRGLAKEVVGVFRRSPTLRKALKYKVVDSGVMSIRDGVRRADLIILATPVYLIPELARQAAKYAEKGTIITDVGSTKAWIITEVNRRLKNKSVFFVGSHPMAGSERAGAEFSRNNLLEGSPCIVTATSQTDKAALKAVVNFWKSLGANVEIMDPAAHDRNVALISHLPHVVAFSLAGAVPGKALRYAAEGFKDTTRVASSDPILWAEIFLTNRKELAKACLDFERYFNKMRKAISGDNLRDMVRLLKASKAKRDKFVYGAKR